jgi:O-antigen/teichoic acid export membrane protein
MRQKAKKLMKHPLIRGSGILVIGGLVANSFNFLFNLFMSRSLTVSEYGVFASVMSLIVFPALVSGAIVPVVVRFAGDYFAKKNFALLRGLYIQIKKLLLIVGIAVFFLFLFITPTISNFFHIADKNILFMTDIIIFFSLIGVINMAFLQAKLAFGFQVFVTLITGIVKLLFGVLFILLGYSVAGATMATLIAGIVAYLVSFIPLKFVFDRKIASPSISKKELLLYGFPSTMTLMGLTSFISVDIMLVKHFFDPHQAGLYAGLSLISRVIFYVSAPIGSVMFPLIVQKHSRNENVTNTFKLSLLLVFIPSLLLTIIYALFPKFAILFFLKREEYLFIVPYLTPFALFITLFGVLSIMSNFYLSIKKTKVFIPIVIGAIVQIFCITLFHETFLQIIYISTIITLVLIGILLVYYPYATKK